MKAFFYKSWSRSHRKKTRRQSKKDRLRNTDEQHTTGRGRKRCSPAGILFTPVGPQVLQLVPGVLHHHGPHGLRPATVYPTSLIPAENWLVVETLATFLRTWIRPDPNKFDSFGSEDFWRDPSSGGINSFSESFTVQCPAFVWKKNKKIRVISEY